MKIAFITPFPPYRGGISKYSESLYTELSKKNNVKVYNFIKQYPNLLFPGKQQYIDSSSTNIEYNMIRSIHSFNPVTWKKTAKIILQSNHNIILIRYWNPFFIPCYNYIAKFIKKNNSKIKIFSICDNIIPHENFILNKYFVRKFLKKMDGIIVMSKNVEEELLEISKNFNYKKLFLPIIDDQNINNEESFIKKNDKKKIRFIFFGLIRKYKGLDILLLALNNIDKRLLDSFELIIVGESYEKIENYKSILNTDVKKNVTWINEYVLDNDVNKYFLSSDFVVLPYKSASQSAIIPMAYNYNKPVIISNLSGLTEYVIDKETGYIFSNLDYIELSNILTKIIKNNKNNNMTLNIARFKKNISAKKFANELLEFIS